MSQADDPAAQRMFLAQVLAELVAVRRARVLSLLVLAAAMLVAGLGAALQSHSGQPDAALLFSALGLIMIGIVSALGAIIAWTRINRDLLDSVVARRPAQARAPRTRSAGAVVALGFGIVGVLFGALLWGQAPVLAGALVVACLLMASLGPVWAGELSGADDRLAVILDSDDELATRFATFTPMWLHEATESDTHVQEQRRNP